jgi:hypothetical protein
MCVGGLQDDVIGAPMGRAAGDCYEVYLKATGVL